MDATSFAVICSPLRPRRAQPILEWCEMRKRNRVRPRRRQDTLAPVKRTQWCHQFYFASERGRAGYAKYRHDFAKLIWQMASPKWNFDDATFERSAEAFNNPDHVDIVAHNYRWRLGQAEGESRYSPLDERLAALR